MSNANGFTKSSTHPLAPLTNTKPDLWQKDIVKCMALIIQKLSVQLLNMTLFELSLQLRLFYACTCVNLTSAQHTSTTTSPHASTCANLKGLSAPNILLMCAYFSRVSMASSSQADCGITHSTLFLNSTTSPPVMPTLVSTTDLPLPTLLTL